jgi:transcriptional regulator with XRE-family HTH domain
MISQRFGELLRQLRKGQGAKATVTSSVLNITDDFLWMLEKGKRLPSLDLLIRMAEIFDCSESWLFEQYLTAYLIWEEKNLRADFERLSGKRGLKLPPPPPSERFDKRSGRPLRPEWDTALKKIPLRGIAG